MPPPGARWGGVKKGPAPWSLLPLSCRPTVANRDHDALARSLVQRQRWADLTIMGPNVVPVLIEGLDAFRGTGVPRIPRR